MSQTVRHSTQSWLISQTNNQLHRIATNRKVPSQTVTTIRQECSRLLIKAVYVGDFLACFYLPHFFFYQFFSRGSTKHYETGHSLPKQQRFYLQRPEIEASRRCIYESPPSPVIENQEDFETKTIDTSEDKLNCVVIMKNKTVDWDVECL